MKPKEKAKSVQKAKPKKKTVKSKKKSIKHIEKTNGELKQLAEDIYAGRVFTDRDAMAKGMGDMLHMIFMPILFLDSEAKKDFVKRKPVLLYEYMSAAMPRMVNGCPMFMSVRYLTEKEFIKMRDYYAKIKAAMDSIK